MLKKTHNSLEKKGAQMLHRLYRIRIIIFRCFIWLIPGILLMHCTGNQSLATNKIERVAVLPFTARGAGISARTGHVAADQLTSFLFSEKNMAVVDRSQVNASLNQAGINNLYFLGKNALLALADSLNADCIVMGIIDSERLLNKDLSERHRGRLSITLRLLEGESGEIRNIVQESQNFEHSPAEKMNAILREIVGRL